MGEYESRDIDIRAMDMSNRNLAKEVEAGRFRRGLYDRLKSFHITMPPLRERLDDILLLAEYLYHGACQEMHKSLGSFAPGVLEMLKSYHLARQYKGATECDLSDIFAYSERYEYPNPTFLAPDP
ncbi:sigma 54-interacting transcriptional regulator [Candidatus Poribacteria bacterium]